MATGDQVAQLIVLMQQQLQRQEARQQEQQQQQLLQQQQLQRQEERQQQQHTALLQAIGAMTASAPQRQVLPFFPSFDESKEKWCSYAARLQQHLAFHKVTDEDSKRELFLSISSSEMYELLQKLSPQEPVESLKFSEIMDKLNKFYVKEPHVIAARYRFYQSRMQLGQTHAQWVVHLKGLARECGFACECGKSYAGSLIRDMLVVHTPEDKVRYEALQKNNPPLEEVCKLASVHEVTTSTAQQMEAGRDVMQVKERVEHKAEVRKNPTIREKESSSKLKSCRGCFVSHDRKECRFYKAKCFRCNKVGHIQSVCTVKGKIDKKARKLMEIDGNEAGEVNEVLSSGKDNRISTSLVINKSAVEFQIDTGSPVTLMNLVTYQKIGAPRYDKAAIQLRTFNKKPIPVKGVIEVAAKYKGVTRRIKIWVVDRYDTTNILGLDAFDKFGFKIQDQVNMVSEEVPFDKIEELTEKYADLFAPQLGKAANFEARVHLKPEARPRFCKARTVPLALREQVERQLKKMIKEEIVTPVSFSDWATPLVLVKKSDGSIRLCGDFKATVNAQLQVEKYPIPKPEDLFQKLSGGKYFSKIDLKEAYLQLPLDEESKKCLTVNTPIGLLQYQRLPFGVASAAAIFQRYIEQVIAQIPGCISYLDDIVVTGASNEEHLRNLEQLLCKLRQEGLKAKLSKCEFFRKQIKYLGHVLDSEGVKPTAENVQAIMQLPAPANIRQLQSFMGKANYYAKFIKQFATVAAPLNALRKKGARFAWSEACQQAFDTIKGHLIEAVKLTHFNPEKMVTLATDASEYGIGAVLSQKNERGEEVPVAFASKTLNVHQRRYSQIEKEALAVIYGVRKFNDYLFGNKFIIITDHKPLVALFHPAKKVPDNMVRKLQRWSLFLSDYNYEIIFRSTAQHANADALSRLPVGDDAEFDSLEVDSLQIDMEQNQAVQQFPVDARRIARATDQDPVLKKTREYVRTGWPTRGRNIPFFKLQERLSVKAGILLLSTGDSVRVVVPASLRREVLRTLHRGHWGIVLTKQLARQNCYWPGIDRDIEKMIRECRSCQAYQKNPRQQWVSWPEPEGPWDRLHIDFAGPFQGSTWLIVTDAQTNFPYVTEMSNPTAHATVRVLQRIFSIEGLPRAIASDNGPQFTAEVFQRFCDSNGIKHILAPPYHPRSNGEAERFVQTFKSAMAKAKYDGVSREQAVLSLLASYRAMPGRDGMSPAQRLHGRQPRTLLSLMQPTGETRKWQVEPKFAAGNRVFIRSFRDDPKWVPGKILKVEGARVYVVRTQYKIVRRHQEHIRSRTFEIPEVDEALQTRVAEPDRNLGRLFGFQREPIRSTLPAQEQQPAEAAEQREAEDEQQQEDPRLIGRARLFDSDSEMSETAPGAEAHHPRPERVQQNHQQPPPPGSGDAEMEGTAAGGEAHQQPEGLPLQYKQQQQRLVAPRRRSARLQKRSAPYAHN